MNAEVPARRRRLPPPPWYAATSPSAEALSAFRRRGRLRRADAAALLVGVATLGCTLVTLLVPSPAHHVGAASRPAPRALQAGGLTGARGGSGSTGVAAGSLATGAGGITGGVAVTGGVAATGGVTGGPITGGPITGARVASDRLPAVATGAPFGQGGPGGRRTSASAPAASAVPATTASPVPDVSLPCSQVSLVPALVTFVNTSPAPVRLDALSRDCARSAGANVPPGGRHLLSTWVGRAWAFVDPVTGRVIGGSVVTLGQDTVIMP